MATRTTASILDNTTDALFRAWGGWISGSFTAFGWTATYSLFGSGTNWTDVTRITSANTARVTEIWAMADAAQATAPLFVKIEYGVQTTTTLPGMRFSVGTGHNGSGTLTGILLDSGAAYIGLGVLNANAGTHYASGDTGRITFCLNASATSWANTNPMFINLERRRNTSGVGQATGWLYSQVMGSGQKVSGGGASSSIVSAFSALYFPAVLTVAADATFDSKTGVWPLLHPMGPAEQGLGVTSCVRASNPVGTTFSCNSLGASHTYIALQMTGLTALAGASLINMAMLYE